jgi:hypothetical protein
LRDAQAASKDVILGDERYQYDPMHYLLPQPNYPIASHITAVHTGAAFLILLPQT